MNAAGNKKSIQEIETARIIAGFFKCEVTFIPERNSYKATTPDVQINGVLWEMKHPEGTSKKHTIKRQLKRSKRQSRNIIIGTSMTPLDDEFIYKEMIRILRAGDVRAYHLLMVNKQKDVIVLK